MAVITLTRRLWFAVVLIVASLASQPLEAVQPTVPDQHPVDSAAPLSTDAQSIRISQVFGGGTTSAPYPCDFIELFNASAQPVSLAGWSVQIAYARANSWSLGRLGSATVAGYGYVLVAGACALPTPSIPYDIKTTLNVQAAEGKAVVARTESLITGLNDPAVVDFVGYGGANAYEGAGAAPASSASTTVLRKDGGCMDSDDNAADFAIGSVSPRNSYSPTHPCPESAPSLWRTRPANGATSVARNAVLTVDFSEPVTLDPDWFEIRCDLSGARSPASATVTGGPENYTINPDVDFFGDDACRMTIAADAVHDSDESDPPDVMVADYVADFRTVPGQCGDPAYPIHDIQDPDGTSQAAGQVRTVEGIVTADFQGDAALSGYFLQEEATDADTDSHTSEGIFVDEHAGSLGDVVTGTRVRVTGTVSEAGGMTSLTSATRMIGCGAAEGPEPVDVALPLALPGDWEQYESMVVRFGGPLTVADTAHLGTEGRLTLVSGGVPRYYTQQNTPSPAGFAAWENDLALRTVILDDGSEGLNPDPIRYPPPGLSATNTVRAGDAVGTGLTGVVDGRDEGNVIQPTAAVTFLSQNQRAAAPARAAGNIRVAFLSLEDYFNLNGTPAEARGASSPEEFVRQRDKLVRSLVELDADVITASQLENAGFGPEGALADLVAGLNAASAPGTYAFVDAGLPSWGNDVVTVGSLYRASAVVPIGSPATLATGAFDQIASPIVHRAPMVQTFEEATWGERFTVVVNEWHNRAGCPTGGLNADAGDGQGCWTAARAAAADDLRTWLGFDPTSSGDPDFLVLGELNAFGREDPIQRFTGGGYVDLINRYIGSDALTTLVDARAGYSDHALASPTMAFQVVGASVWGINAEEPAALDYQMENKSASQLTTLYAPDAYRSSDQNPVIVDLSLVADQSDLSGNYGTAWHTGQGVWRLGQAWGGADDGAVRGEGSWNDGQGELIVSVQGPAQQYACLYAWLDFSDGTTEPGVTDRPDGDWDANEQVIDGLALTPGDAQTLTFPLPTGVVDDGADANMRFRLIPAPEPLAPQCPSSAAVEPAGAGPGPTGRADGGEVEDYAFPPSPLAVEMSSFTARARGSGVLLEWETICEENTLGFNLYRRGATGGAWSMLNEALIASQTPGASLGNIYKWQDTGVEPGRSYTYQLEELGLNGESSFYGPVEATPGVPDAVNVRAFSGIAARPVGVYFLMIVLLVIALPGLRALRRR